MYFIKTNKDGSKEKVSCASMYDMKVMTMHALRVEEAKQVQIDLNVLITVRDVHMFFLGVQHLKNHIFSV